VSEFSESRLWRTLDNVVERLANIENQLSELVRLEERVNNHEQVLKNCANRLDSHESRIRDTELWQAYQGDKSSVERLINNLREEINSVRSDVFVLQSRRNVSEGQVDVGKGLLKWAAGILAGILIFILTKG